MRSTSAPPEPRADRSAQNVSVALAALTREWREMIAPASIGANVAAGITVAMVAIPLNLALAVACGLPPAAGLVSGAVAGAIGSLLGGARVNVTGPEVALAPLTAFIVAAHGVDGMLVATALAGAMQIALGLLGAGRLVHAFPRPVVAGFLAGVGVLVFDTQLPHLVGLHDGVPISAMRALPALSELSLPTLAIGAGVVLAMTLLPRIAPRAPAPLVGVAVAIAVTASLGLDVERITAIGPGALALRAPDLASVDLVALLPSAVALALLASVDSLLCAVSIDARLSGPRHRPDHELVAQGVANLACAFVGGMPVAAAVVRSVAAVEAGASTRLTGLVQSIVLLVTVLVLGRYLALVPFAALAGVLLVVGSKLLGIRQAIAIARVRRSDAAILLATTIAIVTAGFVEGLAVGIALALIALARESAASLTASTTREGEARRIRLLGPLVFASQERLAALLDEHGRGAQELIVDLDGVTAWDASGLSALRDALARLACPSARVVVGRSLPVAALARELDPIATVEAGADAPVAAPRPRPSHAPRVPALSERWAVESAE